MGLLQDDLGRDTRIEKIRFNPYAPSLRVQGFEVLDTDGTRLAAFDELYVNFQWASLLKWAWTFSDVQLRNPFLHFERFDNGDTRLGLRQLQRRAQPAATGADDQSVETAFSQRHDLPRRQ